MPCYIVTLHIYEIVKRYFQKNEINLESRGFIMSSFIHRLNELLQEKEVTPYKLAKDIDMPQSLVTKWKSESNATPSVKIAIS